MITEVEDTTGHTKPGDWERGYAAGYNRALSHMTLLGCDCTDGSCKVCELVRRLEDVEKSS